MVEAFLNADWADRADLGGYEILSGESMGQGFLNADLTD